MILQDIINTLSLPEFYFAVFRSATPVLLTTLGAMIASRSGTNTIALEGTMLISAFVGVVVSAFTQSAWIGFFGAVLAGFLISNILAYFILKLNSNSVISGIALNTFASGGTIHKDLADHRTVRSQGLLHGFSQLGIVMGGHVWISVCPGQLLHGREA